METKLSNDLVKPLLGGVFGSISGVVLGAVLGILIALLGRLVLYMDGAEDISSDFPLIAFALPGMVVGVLMGGFFGIIAGLRHRSKTANKTEGGSNIKNG